MYYNLFLDDERIPEDVTWLEYDGITCWHTIRTYEHFKEAIAHCIPEYISFDHDIQCFGSLLSIVCLNSSTGR